MAFDYLSTLTAAEISVTSTTTLTIGRQHVFSGSSFTANLPAASGNTGKFIGYRVSPSATGLYTLDGNSSETIDGVLTQIVWADESGMLYCDGSNWVHEDRARTAMRCRLSKSGSFSAADATNVFIAFDTVDIDNTGFMADLSSTPKRVVIQRPGSYLLEVRAFIPAGSPSVLNYSKTCDPTNSTDFGSTIFGNVTGGYWGPVTTSVREFSAADAICGAVGQFSGSPATFDAGAYLQVVERTVV